MIVEKINGDVLKHLHQTPEEIEQKLKEALASEETAAIHIYPEGPNRHERRKAAAEARKKQQPSK